ncbi:MAG: DUF881 domain-containing protein [Lapillicoccus sp.]
MALFGHRPTAWSAVVPVVALVAGLLFATSFQTARGTDLRSVGQGLPDLIRSENRQVQTKAERLQQLQTQVDGLTAAAAPGSTEVRDLTDSAAALAAPVGTQAVHGPAVTVTLDDAHRSADSLPKPYGPDDIVVHQQDVQGVVNALWAGGAEAMMIQDQRVIATSAVRCVGNTLILQGRVYSPPYVISAIGPTGDMQTSLRGDPQVKIYREWVDAVGLTYDVRVSGEASFPAYAGPVSQASAVVSR